MKVDKDVYKNIPDRDANIMSFMLLAKFRKAKPSPTPEIIL